MTAARSSRQSSAKRRSKPSNRAAQASRGTSLRPHQSWRFWSHAPARDHPAWRAGRRPPSPAPRACTRLRDSCAAQRQSANRPGGPPSPPLRHRCAPGVPLLVLAQRRSGPRGRARWPRPPLLNHVAGEGLIIFVKTIGDRRSLRLRVVREFRRMALAQISVRSFRVLVGPKQLVRQIDRRPGVAVEAALRSPGSPLPGPWRRRSPRRGAARAAGGPARAAAGSARPGRCANGPSRRGSR